MSTPKVLLVEDDSSIARFVQMALEELPIELVTCANVPDAMQTLHAGGGWNSSSRTSCCPASPTLTSYSGCCRNPCRAAGFRWRCSAQA